MNLHDLPAESMPTRAELRALEAQALRDARQARWENEQLKGLDKRTRAAIVKQLRARQATDLADGNRWLLALVKKFKTFDLPFNPSEDEIDAAAASKSEHFARFLSELSVTCPAELLTREGQSWSQGLGIAPNALRQAIREGTQEAKAAIIQQACRHNGIEPPKAKHLEGLIARLTERKWWLRAIRTEVTRNAENLAREIGLVSNRRGLYVSDASFDRFTRRKRANHAFLEAFEAINEDGEIFTLAELSAIGLAAPDKRRAEVMTRIAGMEGQARKRGDAALFITLTCPGWMHAMQAMSGERNPNFRGTTPREAQDYLRKIGDLIRSKLCRDGIECYGLRVAEPHHDGTPHWHLLLFCAPGNVKAVRQVFAEYALRESPDEPGAHTARCKFLRIDWERGTATGYVAKYVAKNIDGFGLNEDEHGIDAPTAAQRVQAWASTHGIRQFQQWGAAPVGLWREARKIQADALQSAPQLIREACRAAHRHTETGEKADFGDFCEKVGGVSTPRKNQRIKLAKEASGQLGRYHEPKPAKPCGLYLASEPKRVVRSLRREWRIERRARAPWTRLNNCTHPTPPNDAGSPPAHIEVALNHPDLHLWHAQGWPPPPRFTPSPPSLRTPGYGFQA